MVAAWIWAETGVGPAMASGSQTISGTWADLPIAASNISSPRAVITPIGTRMPILLSSVMDTVPKSWNIQTMAIPRPMSPMRVTMKALRPAVAFLGSLYQNPINAYEQKPTPSHPR